ncbi:serine/threonine-protein kinase [Noviherbaspirillum sp. 1P10PC]|uniref:serine/threonine protein kinase n=1 Tax=Noviherbaspirillum sp. 1P10PC TaxID=3132292 RepID=UPI0039A35028
MEKKRILNAPLPENTALIRYNVLRVIARGSFSFVYLAENSKKQLVAIKEYMPQKLLLREQEKLDLTISPEQRQEFRKFLRCFVSECRTLSCVTHPGIVRVIDFFRGHNTFYIVMSYAPGSSLKEFIRRRVDNRMFRNKDSLFNAYLRYRHYKKQLIGSRQVIGERSINRIFSQLIDGISMLHDQELLYLDLKPANIYLRHDGTSILLDFGAVRRTSEKNPKELSWILTRSFAAPELVKKQQSLMGPWTDAYSIGATIFACLCGHAPQTAEQRLVKDQLPQSLRALGKMYSSDLLGLVEWCMCLEPERRPQTMAELQDRLLACQLNSPPAPRKKLIRRLSKWVQKKMKAASPVSKYS